MKIFGYRKGGPELQELQELQEMSIQCDLAELERVIEFLGFVRDRMATCGESFGHEHFSDWDKQKGSSTEADCDIVIAR